MLANSDGHSSTRISDAVRQNVNAVVQRLLIQSQAVRKCSREIIESQFYQLYSCWCLICCEFTAQYRIKKLKSADRDTFTFSILKVERLSTVRLFLTTELFKFTSEKPIRSPGMGLIWDYLHAFQQVCHHKSPAACILSKLVNIGHYIEMT